MGKSSTNQAVEVTEQTEEVAPRKYVIFKDAQHFDVREISSKDWAKVDVQDAPSVRWDVQNQHRVPIEDFGFLSEEQFSRYILADARLEVVEL